jgi:hypothetical protein
MRRSFGLCLLGLSAAGYPLTRVALRRGGRPGAIVVEAVSAGLAVRDAAMIAGGAPDRLRPIPAILLRLELAAGIVASVAGVSPLRRRARGSRPRSPGEGLIEGVRRTALMALFALHTIRFGIYLQPDQGRRKVI